MVPLGVVAEGDMFEKRGSFGFSSDWSVEVSVLERAIPWLVTDLDKGSSPVSALYLAGIYIQMYFYHRYSFQTGLRSCHHAFGHMRSQTCFPVLTPLTDVTKSPLDMPRTRYGDDVKSSELRMLAVASTNHHASKPANSPRNLTTPIGSLPTHYRLHAGHNTL